MSDGYESGERRPIAARAWKFSESLTRGEPKVEIYLTSQDGVVLARYPT